MLAVEIFLSNVDDENRCKLEDLFRLKGPGPNPYREPNGMPPAVKLGDGPWFAFYGDVSDIPVNIGNFDERMSFQFEEEGYTDSGSYVKLEWATQPFWHRDDKPWEMYIPVAQLGNSNPPFYLDFTRRVDISRDQYGLYFMDRLEASRYREMIQRLHRCLKAHSLQAAENIWPSSIYPESVNEAHIVATYDSVAKVQIMAANIRRAIVSILGFLIHWSLVQPSWISNLPTGDGAEVVKIIRSCTRLRGSVFDPLRNASTLNPSFMVANRIPQFYKWDVEESSSLHLVRLDPHILALRPGLVGGDIALFDVPNEELVEERIQHTWLYDDFFQELSPTDCSYVKVQAPRVGRYAVVDFKGWGRRTLPNDDVLVESYEKTFHFVEALDENTRPLIVFLMWMPRNPARDLEWDAPRGENWNLSFLRETGRDELSPTRGRTFHEWTGAMLSPVNFSEYTNMEINWGTGYKPPVLSANSARFTDGAVVPSSRSLSRSLSSRLTLSSKFKDEDMGRRRDKERSPWSCGRLPHPPGNDSVSPPSPTIPFFLSLLRPYMPQHASLELGKLSWNPNLLKHGILIVPDPAVSDRLRYIASQDVNIQTVDDLLTRALEYHLPFNVGVGMENFNLFATPFFGPPGFTSAAPMVAAVAAAQDPKVLDHEAFIQTWHQDMMDLLNRPQAQAFLGKGNGCAWIALKFKRLLIYEFIQGPSERVTRYDAFVSLPEGEALTRPRWDFVTPAEVRRLLGYGVYNGELVSLFPPWEMVVATSRYWDGIWTSRWDQFYENIYDEITNTPRCALKTVNQWKEEVDRDTTTQMANGPLPLTKPANFNKIVGEALMLSNLPRSWDRLRVKDLPLEEDFA